MSDHKELSEAQKEKKAKRTLLVLAALFTLPFIMAATLHFLDIRPGGKSFGGLITPPISLEIPELRDIHGKPFTPAQWEKKWSVVMIDHHGCDTNCQSIMDKLNRVHLSLAKEAKRVQRVLILPASTQDFRSVLHGQFPNLQVLTGETASYVNVFESASSEPSIYLVDPLGNLMMHYPVEVPPKELRSDLVRLLKNSWAG